MRISGRILSISAAIVLLAACDGRPLLYQIAPSQTDIEVLAAFRMIDTANAGRLTRQGVDDHFRRRFAELDRNRDGFLDEQEASGAVPIFGFKTGAGMIFSLDINGDGRLSPDEFLRLSNYLFTRDLNRDGILTLEEVRTPPSDSYVSAAGSRQGLEMGVPKGGQP